MKEFLHFERKVLVGYRNSRPVYNDFWALEATEDGSYNGCILSVSVMVDDECVETKIVDADYLEEMLRYERLILRLEHRI